jgi:hypothetical protein
MLNSMVLAVDYYIVKEKTPLIRCFFYAYNKSKFLFFALGY